MEPHEIDIRKQVLARLLQTIQTRREQYHHVLLTTLLHLQGESWRPILTKLEFKSKEDSTLQELSYDYGDVQLVRSQLDLSQATYFIDQLMKGLFYLEKFPVPIGFNGTFDNFSRYPSPTAYYVSEWSKWPSEIFTFEPLPGSVTAQPSGRPLVSVKSPFFPNFGCVLRDCFGVSTPNWSHYFNGRIVFVCPDYSARIQKMIVGFNFLRVDIENRSAALTDLRLTLYAEGRLGVVLNKTVLVEGPNVELYLEQRPISVWAAIVSANEDKVLHLKSYESRSGWVDPDVETEVSSSEIEQLLLLGECETIEFRLRLGYPLRLAKCVVAFANSEGGTIVFGIDPDGVAVGVEQPNLADSITDCIAAHCDPPPQVRIERVVYEGNNLVVLRVEKSSGIIHNVRNHGPYIRVNATSRRPSSFELNRIQGVSANSPLRFFR